MKIEGDESSAELADSMETSIAPMPRLFVGDSTLRVVLEKCCRPSAVWARLGGEEGMKEKSSEKPTTGGSKNVAVSARGLDEEFITVSASEMDLVIG